MATTKRKKKSTSKKDKDLELIGVDFDLGLYELTDLFNAYYRYHNEDYLLDYDHIVSLEGDKMKTERRSLSRFDALRRIEICRLGSRPFVGGKGIAIHRPNVSMGYLNWMLSYLTLPYESVFTDGNLVKLQINKQLFDEEKLTEDERLELQIQSANTPSLVSNAEVSDDVSDAYTEVLRTSKKFQKAADVMPLRIAQDGLVAFVHSDVDWTPEPVYAIDLVTEPQAEFDAEHWSSFFIIRKITAQEVVSHIRKPGAFWDAEALRWALESARNNRGILSYKHYYSYHDGLDETCGENFAVKSFMSEKSARRTNIGSYYGNMLVVEGYYKNKDGKVDKVIFFPSKEFVNVNRREQLRRGRIIAGTADRKEKDDELLKNIKGANVLFQRKNVFKSMEEAVTVIPFDRAEVSLERQRAYGQELFHPLEIASRLDTAILNFAILMGVPFVKNRAEGTDAQNLEDLEIMVNGEMSDLGDRDFVETPFTADLNGMLGVRTVLLQHAAAKAFLGGLDGNEVSTNGRGAQLANLRLVRDGRVHKHNVEDFAAGLRELLTKMFRRILDLNEKSLAGDPLLQKKFFDVLTKVQGHSEDLFKFKPEDIIADTNLPYWMSLEAIRNGGSHFGAGELVIFESIMNTFGAGLDQQALQNIQRQGIKSILGAQDAIDILGDPKEGLVTDQDQIYQATLESGAIAGSVDTGTLNFKPIPIRLNKDNHVLHLSQVHNPDAQEIIQRLQEGDVTPQKLQELSEDQLDTRINLILKLGAIGNHSSLHQQALERFGRRRDDINQLREETNTILQTAEALINNLQVTIRAAQQKRQERELRLQNQSPENEAEKMKQQNELLTLQAAQQEAQGKLVLANRIANDRQQQHIDKQVSKARDRNLKRDIAERQSNLEEQQLQVQQEDNRNKAINDRLNGINFGGA